MTDHISPAISRNLPLSAVGGNTKRFWLWWGDSCLISNCDREWFGDELGRRDYNLDVRWLSLDWVDRIGERIDAQPNGIILIGTTPAFMTRYGERIPARAYQIIWKTIEA